MQRFVNPDVFKLVVVAVAVTPDGRRAVSASADQTLRLWEPGVWPNAPHARRPYGGCPGRGDFFTLLGDSARSVGCGKHANPTIVHVWSERRKSYLPAHV